MIPIAVLALTAFIVATLLALPADASFRIGQIIREFTSGWSAPTGG